MAEIFKFPRDETSVVPCKTVLETSLAANLKNVLVIGTDNEGQSFVAASHGNVGANLYLMERAKVHMMDLAEAFPDIDQVGPPANR